jgi:hypothetical protein
MKRRSIVLAACVLAIMVMAPWAHGQAPAAKPAAPTSDAWEFSVTPYIWATQVDSKVTVKGHNATSTTTFSDIWDNLNMAGLIHFEGIKGGKWGFFLDGIYLKIRGDGDYQRARTAGLVTPPTRDLTLAMDTLILEFGGIYQLAKWSLEGQDPGQTATIDALGGGRYWYMSIDLDTTSRINPSGNDDWVDPFVGLRAKIDLSKKLSLNVRGDIGGFGVGSHISYNGLGFFGYSFTPKVTALVGYRAMYVDYERSSGRVRYKETLQGPIAGLTIVF